MKTLKVRLKEKLDNVYLFEGDDYQLFLRGIGMIKRAAGLNLEDFNLTIFDEENYSMKAVIDACQILPMGDDYRLVILKNIEKLSENDKKMLQNYLKNAVSTTILIISDYFGKFASLKNDVAFVDCNRFDKATLSGVVAREFVSREKKISQEALDTLIEYCDGYLTRIMSEIDKLVYYSEDEMISKAVVEKLVTKNNDVVIYELTESLGVRNADKALKLIETLKKESGILGLITSHFRRLFFISISDLPDSELAALLGVKEYAIKKQRQQVKNFSKIQLKKIYALLEQVDYMIKSGAMLQENALYFLGLSILYI